MRINTVITEQAQALKGMSDILGSLDTGDLVKAKVLEATTGEVLLKLFDGTVFRAAVASHLETSPGETLELMVKGKNGDTLIMETVKKNTAVAKSADDIALLLNSLGIKPGKQAAGIASEIKEADMNVTRNIFDNAATLLNSFKNLTPEKAVFLSTSDIDVRSSSAIKNAIRIIEGSLQLGSQLDELGKLLSAISGSDTYDINSKTDMTSPSTGGKDSSNGTNAAVIKQNSMQTSNDISGKPGVIENSISEKVNITESALSDKTIYNSVKNTDSMKEKGTFPDTNNEFNLIEKSNLLLTGTGRDIDNSLKEIHKASAQEIRKLSSGIKKALDSLFIKVNKEGLSSSELNIKEAYKNIYDKLESIKQINEALMMPDGPEITAKLQEIEEGIKLLHQFSNNNNNVYVQLPMSVNGFNTTAELYIYKKDKGRKRIDPKNAVVLIALDTQNLGRIESVIDVKGKNVSISIRAEEEKVISFLKESYKLLYSGLLDKGYRLTDVKYKLAKERMNPANAGRVASGEFKAAHVSVDLKI